MQFSAGKISSNVSESLALQFHMMYGYLTFFPLPFCMVKKYQMA